MRSRTTSVVGLAAAAVLLAGCGGDPDRPSPGEPPPPRPTLSSDVPGLIWTGNLETGDLSQFQDTPWNVHGGAEEPELVTEPVREGRYALAVTIPGESTGEGITGDSRSEVQPDIDFIKEGEELYFGLSVMLGENYPVDQEWQTLTQWKNEGEGSPPVELSAQEGSWNLAGGAGHPDDVEPFIRELAPLETGTWVDWVVRIVFSTDPEVGEVEVWMDGERVLGPFKPESGTMYPTYEDDEQPASYLKAGYYRAADIGEPGTVYYDALRVGTSAEAVRSPAD
ncbi:MAG TPA: polysaccharide lyase [Pseudonocardia sp.]|nr:polysaccharide lyase [Pseudonocardia sp.]